MDREIAWTVARKDLLTFRKKRGVFYSAALFPIIISVGLAVIIWYVERQGPIPDNVLTNLMNAFAFFFITIAAAIPVGIASYSIVGEKKEKSLEPLLATPATDGEILLGKSIAAFIPAIIAAYIGMGIFMLLSDAFAAAQLGYLYYPNLIGALILLIVTPLVIVLSIAVNVLVSSRVNDVRTATQLGTLPIIPFAGVYVASEIGLVQLDARSLLIMALILLMVDIALLYLSRSTFRREEILIKWK